MENIGHARSLVEQWSDQHNHAVLFDDESSRLLDVASGKSLELPWRDAVGFDVGDREGELEKSLNEVERRAG